MVQTILPDHMVCVWPYGVWLESLLPHFSSLMLTAIQRGAFGGLLPSYKSMGGRPAKRVARAAKSAKPEKPAKLACRKAFITDNSDYANDAVRSKGKIKALQSAVGQVCLRCSKTLGAPSWTKRLHLAGESTSRGKTVPTGLFPRVFAAICPGFTSVHTASTAITTARR